MSIMNNIIIQLDHDVIAQENYINSLTYCNHSFVGTVADCVMDCERKKVLSKLASSANGYQIAEDECGYYLMATNKSKYYAKSFEMFQYGIQRIAKWKMEDFADWIGSVDWQYMCKLYERKDHIYIDFKGNLETLDCFMRFTSVKRKYYIGGIVRYRPRRD